MLCPAAICGILMFRGRSPGTPTANQNSTGTSTVTVQIAKSRTAPKTEDTRHVRIARNTHRRDEASDNWQFLDLVSPPPQRRGEPPLRHIRRRWYPAPASVTDDAFDCHA